MPGSENPFIATTTRSADSDAQLPLNPGSGIRWFPHAKAQFLSSPFYGQVRLQWYPSLSWDIDGLGPVRTVGRH